MATKEVPLEKKFAMKCMYAGKRTENIVRMTRRLCVLIMPHTRFNVNPQPEVAGMSVNSWLKTDAIYEV